MGTVYTVTAKVKVWKKHECVDCACEFRYLFKRKIQGQGPTEKAARKAADKKVLATLETEVDVRPCPTCGRIQPDMEASVKSKRHCWIGLLAIPVVALVLILVLSHVLPGNVSSVVLAAVAILATLLNFAIAFPNPNADLERNKERIESAIESGAVEITTPGNTDNVVQPKKAFSILHLAGLAAGLLAAVVAFAPTIARSIHNLPINADLVPEVVSPGEPVTVYFNEEIDCVKSNWNASVRAVVVNEAELGGPLGLISGTSSNSTWSGSMYVKTKERHTHPTLWATLKFPTDPKLVGKPVRVKVDLLVRFPQATQNDVFLDQTRTISNEFVIVHAPPGGGQKYQTALWAGLLSAGLLVVSSTFFLRSLANAYGRQAIKPMIEFLGDEVDESADEQAE